MRDDSAPKNLAEQKARMIPVAEILMGKPDEFNKKSALLIADSILRDGLLYPPILRKLREPEGDFKYEVIAGKHRTYSMAKVLNWEEIPGTVVDCDDDDARMITIIENVARRSLSEKAYFEQLAEMKKAHAERNKQGSAGGQAAKKARAAKSPDAKPEPEPEEKPKTNFNEMVSAATGKSPRQVQRDIKAASLTAKLSDAEKKIVFPEGESGKPANGKVLQALAQLPAEARSGAIKLAGSGMEWGKAIAKAEEKIVDPTKPKSTDELTDEEYIDASCKDFYAGLRRKDVYRSDVGFYRKFIRIRKRVLKDINELLASEKAAKKSGPLHLRVEYALRVSHPSEWQLCGTCGGTGKTKDGVDPCKKCMAAGYAVRHDPI